MAQFDLTLCARCYVRGNYRVGVNSSDFRRVEISEDTKAGWTDKETLHLLEAVLHYGDDWKKVAEHVGGRNEKECVTHFIKLSFGEQYLGHTSSGDVDNKFSQAKDQSDAGFGQENIGTSSASKKMRLTPLSDASNPIMAQVDFHFWLIVGFIYGSTRLNLEPITPLTSRCKSIGESLTHLKHCLQPSGSWSGLSSGLLLNGI